MLHAIVRAELRVLVLSGLLICGWPSQACADWQLAPFIGWTFKGDTSLAIAGSGYADVHWTFGGSATLIGAGPIGVEALFAYTPGFFGSGSGSVVTDSSSLALMGNVVLATPRAWNEYGLRPFLSGGVGLLHASIEDVQDALPVRESLLGFNLGGGAVGFVTDTAGIRFDLRYFRHLKPLSDDEGVAFGDVRLSYWAAMVGVVFKY